MDFDRMEWASKWSMDLVYKLKVTIHISSDRNQCGNEKGTEIKDNARVNGHQHVRWISFVV
jgi:hypothetical protein